MAGLQEIRRLRAWVLAAQLIGGAWLAFSPAPPKQADLGWDKANHAVGFAVLAATAHGLARPRLIAGGLLGYGVFIEAVQSQLPTRSAEIGDVLADGVGIAIGMLAVNALRARGNSARRRPPPPP